MKKNHHDNASKKKVREPGWLYARAYSSDAELREQRCGMQRAYSATNQILLLA
jgi:hypothetical protein